MTISYTLKVKALLVCLILMFGLLVATALTCHAQAPAPTPATSSLDVHVGGDALGSGGEPGTNVYALVAFKGSLHLRADTILVPTSNLQYYGGGVEFPFLQKQLAKTNLKALEPYITASVGAVRYTDPAAGKSHWAWLGGGGLKWNTSSGISVRLAEFRYADFPGYGRKFVVSGGFSYIFGQAKQ